MGSLSKEKINLLINNVLSQAKYYLDEADEFYPFGAAIDNNNSVRPIGIFFDEDHPESLQVFTKLQEAIKQKISIGEYEFAAIGMDVYINSDNNSKGKISAIQINTYSKNSTDTTYFKYEKSDSGYVFERSSI